MPESETQWPTEKIGKVAKAVELMDVRLVECHAVGIDVEEFDSESYQTRWDVRAFTPSGPVDEETTSSDLANGFDVVIFFDYHDTRAPAEDADESDDEFLRAPLMAAFVLQYRMREDSPENALEDLDGDAVEAFSHFNSAFNAWPYWREYVQSMTQRLGLPPVTVPILRVPNLPGSGE